MSPPTVTVFIAVYNRADFVQQAIDSVLRQSFPDFELLVIDDGSTDESVAVIERCTDPRIRLVRNERNLGIPRTRQRGLELARGRYLAVHDSDDLAPAGRLARQVAFLDRNPDVAIVGGWARKIDATGRREAGVQMLPLRSDQLHARLLFRTCHRNTTIMGRTAILRAHGYRSEFPVAEDYDLFCRVSEHHRLANLPRIFTYRRTHPGRITTERADLVRAMNMKVIAGQLRRLQIAYSPAELALHYDLARIDKGGIAPDEPFLDRAADWFDRLAETNRARRIYQPKALSAVIALMWLKACRRAIPVIGYRAALKFLIARPGR